VNKRLLGSYKFAAGNWANQCPTGMFRRARTSSRRARIRLRKNTSSGADGEPRHHSKVLDAAAYGGEEENLNKLPLTTAMAAMISTGAMAQSTVVTTTGTAHAAAVQQALVERLNGGWRITKKDRTVLEFMENRSSGPQTELDVPVEHLSAAEPAPRLLASTRAGRSQRLQRRRAARARAHAKASCLLRSSSRIGKNRKLSGPP
jgi:hypothetical protein